MDAWMRTAGLIDILSRAQPQPTWKAFEGPQAAALDRVLMPRDSALSVNMKIHWPQPSQVFDHTLIVTRLHHSVAGIDFAGASRLLRIAEPEQPTGAADRRAAPGSGAC